MRICNICKIEKDESEFHKPARGTEYRCKCCKSSLAKKRREEDYFKWYMVSKRSECKRKGLECNITPEYLENIWTEKCPIFGVVLERASKGMGSSVSAHLDRIEPSKGYIEGNVAWISGRANRIKYDASSDELRKIADWMEGATTIPKGSTPEANAGGSAQPLVEG